MINLYTGRYVHIVDLTHLSVSFGQAGFIFNFLWETASRDCKVLPCLKTLLQNLMEFRCQLPTEVLGVSKSWPSQLQLQESFKNFSCLNSPTSLEIMGVFLAIWKLSSSTCKFFSLSLSCCSWGKLVWAAVSCPWKHGGSSRLEGHCWQKEQIYKQKGWMNSQYPSKWGIALPEVFLCELTSFSSSTTAIRKILLFANRGWLTESCLFFLLTTLLSEWVLSRLNQTYNSTWNSLHARW